MSDELRRVMSVDDQIAEHRGARCIQERPGRFTATYAEYDERGPGGEGWMVSNVPRRHKAYGACECAEQEILWVASYECAEPKRVERLLHLNFGSVKRPWNPALASGAERAIASTFCFRRRADLRGCWH
ncbi:hypothetical protein K438DRAFT_1967586 [Mycena galopus ATCC 62051]|nr:hypothetical protein K438DRAFT_1967586 [Mycena galopus ATCC 62051]